MGTITVRVASDDLIEVEGDIVEEFGFCSRDKDEIAYLAFSDGTMLRVVYDHEGCWRITVVVQGLAQYQKKEATDPSSDYSDVVTLTGQEFRAVVLGNRMARKVVAGALVRT